MSATKEHMAKVKASIIAEEEVIEYKYNKNMTKFKRSNGFMTTKLGTRIALNRAGEGIVIAAHRFAYIPRALEFKD
jgi:hypothetical protein